MSRRQPAARPAVEWIAGALSFVVLAALIAFLSHRALFDDALPPRLSVSIEAIEQAEGGAIVWIAVVNGGDAAAAGVKVHAAWADASGDGREREIEFDYVAGHAVRRGAFLLSGAAIAADDVRVEIGGFVEP